MPLTVVRPGSQKRDFTHIDDIIKGCYLAWKKGRQSHYMLGTKKQFTILEVAKMFKTNIKFISSRRGERFKSSISNNNAQNHLNYTARLKIETYIDNFINNK
jgi:UDP-glucose 4-epimerase